MSYRTLPIAMVSSVALASLSPARKVLAVGDASASALAYSVAARTASLNRRVLYICGDNRFDPYAVSRLAKSMGARAEDALRSVLIARAFTAYQFVELIARLSPDPSDEIIVISGPCSTFFDEEVSIVEASRLFYRVLWRIVELARSGRTILLVQRLAIASERRAYFLSDLCRASDVVLRLSDRHSFTLEHRGRVALPYLAALDQVNEREKDRTLPGL